MEVVLAMLDRGVAEVIGRKPVYDGAETGLQLHIPCHFLSSLGRLITSHNFSPARSLS